MLNIFVVVNFHSTLLELELLGTHISGCKYEGVPKSFIWGGKTNPKYGLHHRVGWGLELNEKDGKEKNELHSSLKPSPIPYCGVMWPAASCSCCQAFWTTEDCTASQSKPSLQQVGFVRNFVTAARKVTNTVFTHHPPLPVPIRSMDQWVTMKYWWSFL